MTITKAIEAAREALKIFSGDAFEIADRALAALPEKPMMGDEIATMIRDILIENVDDSSSVLNVTTYDIIRALKAANCLYVEE